MRLQAKSLRARILMPGKDKCQHFGAFGAAGNLRVMPVFLTVSQTGWLVKRGHDYVQSLKKTGAYLSWALRAFIRKLL